MTYLAGAATYTAPMYISSKMCRDTLFEFLCTNTPTPVPHRRERLQNSRKDEIPAAAGWMVPVRKTRDVEVVPHIEPLVSQHDWTSAQFTGSFTSVATPRKLSDTDKTHSWPPYSEHPAQSSHLTVIHCTCSQDVYHRPLLASWCKKQLHQRRRRRSRFTKCPVLSSIFGSKGEKNFIWIILFVFGSTTKNSVWSNRTLNFVYTDTRRCLFKSVWEESFQNNPITITSKKKSWWLDVTLI